MMNRRSSMDHSAQVLTFSPESHLCLNQLVCDALGLASATISRSSALARRSYLASIFAHSVTMDLFDVVLVRRWYKPYVYTKNVIGCVVDLFPSSIVSPHFVIVRQSLIVFKILKIASQELIATGERLTIKYRIS